MNSGYFVTGTDTDVGKTWSTVALMLALQQRGHIVNAMKPVAAGCDWMHGGWKNQDALLLQRYASMAFDYSVINPYAFPEAVSPHLACEGKDPSIEAIQANFDTLSGCGANVLVEGAGGWLSPLSSEIDNQDLAVVLGLPGSLVVGLKLGCLSHARLTYKAILDAELQCAGWIAVELQTTMQGFAENLSFLRHSLHAPLLGVLPHQSRPNFQRLASELQLANMEFY
jgi:dethiobiotin synthetase